MNYCKVSWTIMKYHEVSWSIVKYYSKVDFLDKKSDFWNSVYVQFSEGNLGVIWKFWFSKNFHDEVLSKTCLDVVSVSFQFVFIFAAQFYLSKKISKTFEKLCIGDLSNNVRKWISVMNYLYFLSVFLCRQRIHEGGFEVFFCSFHLLMLRCMPISTWGHEQMIWCAAWKWL